MGRERKRYNSAWHACTRIVKEEGVSSRTESASRGRELILFEELAVQGIIQRCREFFATNRIRSV